MSRRVLVVDGDEHVCAAFEEGLKKAGYEVETICLGWAAEELIDQSSFDLLIVDMMLLGNVSGLSLAKRFSERFPSARVIAVATFEDKKLEQDAAALGIDSYLMKPQDVSPDSLAAHVRRVLSE